MRPVAASARPRHPVEARHTRRSAMRPNEIGRTSWATHTGTPAAIVVPSALSSSTRSTAPLARIVQTAAPTMAANISVSFRAQPAGTNVAVARAMSFPSRAARAAPRNATQRVRCCTNGIDPGIPPATNGRTTISTSGRSTIAASAKFARNSSAARSAARAGGPPADSAIEVSVIEGHEGDDDQPRRTRRTQKMGKTLLRDLGDLRGEDVWHRFQSAVTAHEP